MQQKNLDDAHRDHLRIGAQPVASGQEAATFADVINAVSFSIDAGLNDNTKALAASFCDYVQDLMDLDDVPMSSRLGFAKELDGILQDLRENGASVYSATRDRKFRNDRWGDASALDMDGRLSGYRSRLLAAHPTLHPAPGEARLMGQCIEAI
ncbi:hypothetical protein RAD16_17410 [Bradyrhizobium sp. 18BD]